MELIIRLMYVVMVVGIVLVLLFSRKHTTNIREAVNRFALLYSKIANHISPRPFENFRLRANRTGSGTQEKWTYSFDEQPKNVQKVLSATRDECLIEWFSDLGEALLEVEIKVGRKAKTKEQYYDPLEKLYLSTHFFLNVANQIDEIKSKEELQSFNDYIRTQSEARYILFQRISRALSHEFMSMNEHYRDIFLERQK